MTLEGSKTLGRTDMYSQVEWRDLSSQVDFKFFVLIYLYIYDIIYIERERQKERVSLINDSWTLPEFSTEFR